jgi:hypothetical protein
MRGMEADVKTTILIAAMTAALVACAGKEQTTASMTQVPATVATAGSTTTMPLPPGHPAIDGSAPLVPAPAMAGPAAGAITGRVLETMDAGYTYMRLATAGGEVWTAVLSSKVKKGDTVTVQTQMVADKFKSSSLNRTFDKLVMGVIVNGASSAATPGVASPGNPGTAAEHMTAVADVGDIKVERAAGGKSVSETWAARNEMSGKNVVIRGKVVKFLDGIMGKNWIHLRDGSGTQAAGDNDITVTTRDTAKVGDVVTINGTVKADQDFGAGYVYKVIVEDAKVQK